LRKATALCIFTGAFVPRNNLNTKQRILDAASDMLATESVANVNLDKVGELAGLTKKSLYYHFPSKDHLLSAVVDHLRPNYVAQYQVWAEEPAAGNSMRQRISHIFTRLTEAAAAPSWEGCCFVRLAAELGSLPGHPARLAVMRATQEMEEWFEQGLAAEGRFHAKTAARQLVMLLNGLVVALLVYRSGLYAPDAMELLDIILPPKPS
jgi:AcrR family transcriptional regulator